MKFPTTNIKSKIYNLYDTTKATVRPYLVKGNFKNALQEDVAYFKNAIKANPKTTGVAVGLTLGTLINIAIISTIIKTVKTIKAKNEHIVHQREVINSLKESVEDSQEIIDAQRDIIEAQNAQKEAE